MNEKVKLKVEYVKLEELIPFELNARTHSKEQVGQIVNSIGEFDFVNPILVGVDNMIIAGHGRLMAAKKAGLETVPIIRLPHLDYNQCMALSLADNKIADNAGWDEEKIVEILGKLEDAHFNIDILGFSNKELENYRDEFETNDEELEFENEVPDFVEKPVARRGDVWILGDHRLLCGDATSQTDVEKVMDGEKAQMVFTDPPYNVNYGNALRDKLAGKEGERSILNDNLGEGFPAFLYDFCCNILDVNVGSFYICMGGSELHTLYQAFTAAGGKWEAYIVWVKDKFTLSRSKHQHQHEWILFGNPYEEQHEEILLGAKPGTAPAWYGGRNQTDVWEFPRPQKSALHPTMKPIALVERAIRNSSRVTDIVLDTFGGSGSTLIACEKSGRRCRMIELDEKYVDVIIKRWEEYSRKKAVHEQTGKSYEELKIGSCHPGHRPDCARHHDTGWHKRLQRQRANSHSERTGRNGSPGRQGGMALDVQRHRRRPDSAICQHRKEEQSHSRLPEGKRSIRHGNQHSTARNHRHESRTVCFARCEIPL